MVSIDELFSWREEIGQKAREHFGPRRMAHVSAGGYEEMKRRCDEVRQASMLDVLLPMRPYCLNVHIASDVPDGVLLPCDCREKYAL